MASIDATYIPNVFGRTSFPIKHRQFSVFKKTFAGNNNRVVNIQNDSIYIPNHFFTTGEELIYFPDSLGQSIGISTLSPGASGISTLPQTVYPIVLDKNNIRVALASSLAYENSYVNITSIGVGTVHSLTCTKQNSKCLISIDNIIQSPISVASTVGIVTVSATKAAQITLDSLKNIKLASILKIDSQLFRVTSINYDTKEINLFGGKEFLGTSDTIITGVSTAYVMEGNYNIVDDIIYFTSPPLEGITYVIEVDPDDIQYGDVGISSYSFNYFTNNYKTGSQVKLYAKTPPTGLISNNTYFIIKNSENNFSFSSNYLDAINGNKIQIQPSSDRLNPVTTLQLEQIIPDQNSTFHGRVFLRSDYSKNEVFDDVSEQFNGISSSFTLKVSGINTTGIKTDNGIVLINNIFQYPESDESFVFNEDSVSGITSITFSGVIHPQKEVIGISTVKHYDVNVRGLPRGGIIVSYGSTSGVNYQPPVQAEAYISRILPEQTISADNIEISVPGSGYRTDGVYNVYFESSSGIRTTGIATAIVTDGSVTGFIVSEVGVYTGGNPPSVIIDSPYAYENMPLTGSSAGIGASVSFNILRDGTISNLILTNPGYGYTVGEILTPVGTVGISTQSEDDKLKITINEVSKDKFAAWNIGILQKLEDLSDFANGSRKTFTIKESIGGEIQPLSLEYERGFELELAYNLLIFVNDVLQIPGESYIFNRGTQINFKEAPPAGSSIKVYFYRGSTNDTELVDIDPPIKLGDKVQIQKDLLNPFPSKQNNRTVKKILTSDSLQTEYYNKNGLSNDSSQLRSISWTPQKLDMIISGSYVNKSRYLQRSRTKNYIGIGSILGTFVGVNTNIIGINTSSGIGTFVAVGDYIEGEYVGFGVSVVSIGSSSIVIGETGNLWIYDSTRVSPQKVWYNSGRKGISSNIIGIANAESFISNPVGFLTATYPSAVTGDGVIDYTTSITSSSPSGITTSPIYIWRKL
jgi:hypothetical protein